MAPPPDSSSDGAVPELVPRWRRPRPLRDGTAPIPSSLRRRSNPLPSPARSLMAGGARIRRGAARSSPCSSSPRSVVTSGFLILQSVGFSAAPIFAAAGVWFAVFGVALFLAGCCYCCCRGGGRGGSYSCASLVVSLALLLVSTAAAAVGCAVMYDGQVRFHGSTAATVDYVARQSGDTVANLRGFSGSLEMAKDAGVGPVSLPTEVKGRIDDVVRKVRSASDELAARTSSNAAKIQAALETIRKILIVLAATMLILALAGLVFSLCGLGSLIYVLVFLGWILVTATFVLCGTFLLLHKFPFEMGLYQQRRMPKYLIHTNKCRFIDWASAYYSDCMLI